MAEQLTESRLLDLMREMFVHISRGGYPDTILCGAPQSAAIQAAVDFHGRDRRRVKREINKAMRRGASS